MTTPTRPMPGRETLRRNYPLLFKRMERLMEISRTLVSTLDLPRLLYRIMLAAGELIDTEVASIMLFDPQSIMPAPLAGLRVQDLSRLLPGP